MILQWGKYFSSGVQTHNFPIAFPHACLGIANGDNYGILDAAAHVNIMIISNSQFKMAGGMNDLVGTVGVSAYVFAYGY